MIPPLQSVKPKITWEPLPDYYLLPDDPVENIQQPLLAAALTDALGERGFIQPQMLIGSNFGLVATVEGRTIVKAPDWFYVSSVNAIASGTIRRSYTPYLEGDPVAVVMEFLSESDCGELSLRSRPPYGKLYFYEQILQVPTYVVYDPHDVRLEVRRLQGEGYVAIASDENGRFWIPELGFFLGLWQGERLGNDMIWLRLWDSEGDLLLWSSERKQQESRRAETERERAELESQRAETERQKAEKLAAKLRELGVDPDTL